MVEAARRNRRIVQVGIQQRSGSHFQRAVQAVREGRIGTVHYAQCWNHYQSSRSGIGNPPDAEPPADLDWDLWLGPAPYRPYHPAYLPGNWRRWWDFGTGTLGDMGCHIIDPAFWALDLGYPMSVEAKPAKFNDQTYPEATTVQWEFPARDALPPVTVTWCDGNRRPARPDELEAGRELPDQGGLYYGEKGTILAPHMGNPRLIPESKMKGYKMPEPFLDRGIDHYQDWIKACKGGPKPLANFDYSGPLTETILLGNVAARAGGKLNWDGPNLKVTNVPEVNQYLKREYRSGWNL